MRKRVSCLLALLLALVMVLTACASTESPPATGDGGAAAPPATDTGSDGQAEPDDPPVQIAGATNIVFWTFGDTHAEYMEIAQELWNAENPDRLVQLETSIQPFSQMHENLLMALESGTGAPDLVDVEVGRAEMFLNTPHVPFVPQNEVLQPYMDGLIYSRLEPWMSGGNYYGVCYHVGSVLMFYNISLFEEADLDWNDIVTWDDFVEMGKLMVERTGVPMIQVESGNIWGYSAMVAQQHSDYVVDGRPNLDSPESIRALTMLQDMVYEHGIGRPMVGNNIDAEEFYGEITTNNFASFIAPAWFMGRYLNHAPNQSGNIALAPMPIFAPGNNRSSSAGGTMTAVTNQVDPAIQDLALDFIAWAKASYEMAIYQWTFLGFDPVRSDVLDSPELRQPSPALAYFGEHVFDVLKDVADETSAVKFSAENANAVRTYINTSILPNVILENNQSAEDALREGQAALLAQLGLG